MKLFNRKTFISVLLAGIGLVAASYPAQAACVYMFNPHDPFDSKRITYEQCLEEEKRARQRIAEMDVARKKREQEYVPPDLSSQIDTVRWMPGKGPYSGPIDRLALLPDRRAVRAEVDLSNRLRVYYDDGTYWTVIRNSIGTFNLFQDDSKSPKPKAYAYYYDKNRNLYLQEIFWSRLTK